MYKRAHRRARNSHTESCSNFMQMAWRGGRANKEKVEVPISALKGRKSMRIHIILCSLGRFMLQCWMEEQEQKGGIGE